MPRIAADTETATGQSSSESLYIRRYETWRPAKGPSPVSPSFGAKANGGSQVVKTSALESICCVDDDDGQADVTLGLPALQRCQDSSSRLFVVDLAGRQAARLPGVDHFLLHPPGGKGGKGGKKTSSPPRSIDLLFRQGGNKRGPEHVFGP
ncbi:uncharacterized protein PSFLO_01616 [Pseudozyma flocculosa]|uniref:Uncharacterized protein n=1 Tax=Pseudozyma flocculosa TaxID=84751 RepID=A0A5C3EWK1_9BASI|nr:uncharacterized protein PSFLO_01616 [Pseudozyma flocculosa]